MLKLSPPRPKKKLIASFNAKPLRFGILLCLVDFSWMLWETLMLFLDLLKCIPQKDSPSNGFPIGKSR